MSRKNLLRMFCSVVSALAFVQSVVSVVVMFKNDFAISGIYFAALVFVTAVLVYIVNGLLIEGFLVQRAMIRLSSVGVEICVQRGDILDCEGVAVIAVNDFFDTLVDDRHISAASVHGKMINKFWAGSTRLLDAQISKALAEVNPMEVVKRDGAAKERRYDIGTSVFVKTEKGRRFVLTALSRTDSVTHRTQSSLDCLKTVVHKALSVAREYANGDAVAFYIMGGGNARIKASEMMLFSALLTAIIADTLENGIVSRRVNIVFPSSSPIANINLKDIEKEWSI